MSAHENKAPAIWEKIMSGEGYIMRTRTPTGWLVREVNDCAHVTPHESQRISIGWDWRTTLVFVPDPEGIWLLEAAQGEVKS